MKSGKSSSARTSKLEAAQSHMMLPWKQDKIQVVLMFLGQNLGKAAFHISKVNPSMVDEIADSFRGNFSIQDGWQA